MSHYTELLAKLRAGICDEPCKVKNVMSGCTCAEIVVELERGASAWKAAMEERDYLERRYKELKALMPRSEGEH